MDKHLTSLWENVLSEVKPTVSMGNFNTILKPTYLLSLDDDIATIATPNIMVIDLLQKRFADKIKELLSKQTGREIAVFFIIKAIPTAEKKKNQDMPLFTEPQQYSEQSKKTVKPIAGHLPRVRSDYTFDTFAVSGTNQLAFVSAQTVSTNIGKSYNPLFIYGPVGVGKTHLMCAIANEVYQRDPEKKIVYITSEEFTNEVVEAIKTNDTGRMKKRFRSSYVLLIDDIQFIEGKERVQEELFHTFNILIDNGSQICLSSDRPPHEIKKIEKRLLSRFAGGLTVDIGKPDLELKTAIIGMKAKRQGFVLPNDVAMFLADQAEDTRSLEGLLTRIITQASTNKEPITMDLAKRGLGAVQEERRSHIHAEDVIKGVCEYFNVKSTQLKGPKRDASLVRARQVCMYLLKTELGITHLEIGNLLGGRDHTTIIHGVDKIKNLVDIKANVIEDILGITKYLRG